MTAKVRPRLDATRAYIVARRTASGRCACGRPADRFVYLSSINSRPQATACVGCAREMVERVNRGLRELKIERRS